MDIVEALLQYGLAGLAVYLMYRLMTNHSRHLVRILTTNLTEIKEEIRRLREVIEEVVKK